MKKILKKIKTFFLTFFFIFCIFPSNLDAETLIIYEDFKTNTFTEANPSFFTFHSLSGSPADFNMSDSKSSFLQINPTSNPITSICYGKSLMGGYKVFGQNFDVLQITFTVPAFNRSYFEWGISLDIYEFSLAVSQSMDVYSNLSLSPGCKLLKYQIPGTVDLTNYCSNSKFSKIKYFTTNSLHVASQTLFLLNFMNSPIYTLSQYTGSIRSAVFSPDGLNIVSGSDDDRVMIYNTLTGERLYNIRAFKTVYSVAYSNDGVYLVSVGLGSNIEFWDPSTGVSLKKFVFPDTKLLFVCFSADSRYLALTANVNGYLFDLLTEKIIYTFPKTQKAVFSPDGSLLYVVPFPAYKIQIWRFSPLKFLKQLISSFKTREFVLSSSGSYIAAAGYDQGVVNGNFFIYVCEALTGELLRTYQDPTNIFINTVAFSPNEKYVAGADKNGNINLWETFTGKLVNRFQAHTGAINSIAFSKNDGAYFVSGSYDRKMKLWKTSPFSPSISPLLPAGIGYYGLRNLEIYINLCDQSCEKCAGSSSNCLICVQNAITSDRPGKCICPSGFYWVASSLTSLNNNFICNQCPENCEFCIENKCLSCKTDTFMTIEGKCVDKCPDSWYPEGVFCQKCNDSCLQCTGATANNCLKCASNKYLAPKTRSCELCSDNCEACDGINQCTKCTDNYFFNESLLLCQENICGQNCEVCKDLRLCEKCFDGYFLKKVNFCQKNEEIFVTLKEISNPTLFSLEFSSYSGYIDRNLENILGSYLKNKSGNKKITQRKIPWPKYFQNIKNTSYLIMPIYNSPVPSESFLEFKFSINYFHTNSSYFTLTPENLSVKLLEYLPCNVLTEYYSNASQSVINKTKIVPELYYTNNRSIFELKFINSELIEFFPSLVKNFSIIIIDELHSSHFTYDILEKSNTTFSLRIKLNKSVVMRPKLDYFIDIPIFYSLYRNFIVDPSQASINLFDDYLLDQKDRETQNDFVKQNVILSYFVNYIVFVATIFAGSTSGLQCLMMSNLIQLTQCNQINYPTNLVEIYETTLPSFPTVFYNYKFPIAKKDENVLPEEFLIFEISPYFIDNVGETLSRNSVIFLSTTILNFLCEKIKNTTLFEKILIYIRNFFVWQFFLCFLLDSLVGIVYYMALNIVYVTFSEFSGIFNYFFSIFILVIVIYLLSLVQGIIKKCHNYKRTEQIEVIKFIPEIIRLEEILPITFHQEKQNDSMKINELAPNDDIPHFDEVLQEKNVSDLQQAHEIKLESQKKNDNKDLPSSIHPIILKKCEDNSELQVKTGYNQNTYKCFQAISFFSKLYNPNQQEYLNDFLFLHNSVKNKDFSRHFVLFQIMLQMIIAIVLAAMHSYPLLQMIFVNLLFLSGILILIKNRPFEEWRDFFVELVNEIFTQVFFTILLALAIMDSLEDKDIITRIRMGRVAVIMILAIQYLACFISLIDIILFCIGKIKKLREKSTEKKEDLNKIINN